MGESLVSLTIGNHQHPLAFLHYVFSALGVFSKIYISAIDEVKICIIVDRKIIFKSCRNFSKKF